jgi:hypothetical protein
VVFRSQRPLLLALLRKSGARRSGAGPGFSAAKPSRAAGKIVGRLAHRQPTRALMLLDLRHQQRHRD